jgi:hypothetical protein
MSCSGVLHPLPHKTPPPSESGAPAQRNNDTPFKNPRTTQAFAAHSAAKADNADTAYTKHANDMIDETFGGVHPKYFLDELMPYNGDRPPLTGGGIQAEGAGQNLTQRWEQIIVRITRQFIQRCSILSWVYLG